MQKRHPNGCLVCYENLSVACMLETDRSCSHATSRAKRCQSCCSCCDKYAENYLPYSILLHISSFPSLMIFLLSEGAYAPSRLITRRRQCWADGLPPQTNRWESSPGRCAPYHRWSSSSTQSHRPP